MKTNVIDMDTIKIIKFESDNQVRDILKRPVEDLSPLFPMVASLFELVKREGDSAIRELTMRYDGVDVATSRISQAAIEASGDKIPSGLKTAISLASANITLFHENQRITLDPVEVMPGVKCWQRQVPVEKVGLYIPGGSAPLFSTVLMLAIPARIAGCREIVLCSPPGADGTIDPAILYAAGISGVTNIFAVGGIQAIAAMTYGTESIPSVNKIFGPGNTYVTAAKQYAAAGGMAIDMPAGPSEVMVVADRSASPIFVAADMLSQAEHGPDSQAVLLTSDNEFAERVSAEIDRQLKLLPRSGIARQSIAHSAIVVIPGEEDMLEVVNEYAPEHLIVVLSESSRFVGRVTNAGSVFIGNYSPESAGDYASGTNHTLPTSGSAKGWSGVTLDSFMKRISFQEITKQGLMQLSDAIMVMARAEKLEGHARAIEYRINKKRQ